MPIRLTLAYAARLANERFDQGSQLRSDLVSLCSFWKRLSESAKPDVSARRHILSVVQEIKSAAERLLDESGGLNEFNTLPLHERFQLILIAAVVSASADSLKAVLPTVDDMNESKKKHGEAPIDITEDLADRVANIPNVQLKFRIGTSPLNLIYDFIAPAAAILIEILVSKEIIEAGDSRNSIQKYRESFKNRFEIWLSSSSQSAKWVAEYLNFQHQTAWIQRVPDDVQSIQQALPNWLQPANDASKRRAEAWARYRRSLETLPDLKETMFAEEFGVRRVFVQPLARYKVAGPDRETGTMVHDVANLIASLITERVPGDELILLCGGPGSGKSTLCRIIASQLASNDEMHPLFFRLRRLQDGQDIPSFIETHLQKHGVIDKFSDLADIPNLVIILDGFDELVMASRSRLREFFNTLREDLVTGPLRNAKAIVSGRDTLFPNGAGLPTGSHVISLLPFDKARVTLWGEKWRYLHQHTRGKTFHPEAFYDDRAAQTDGRPSPLHHLVSWPLTLHLVARVHSSGALDLTISAQQNVEKAVLYKSIVAETAVRQQEQSAGKGRLRPEQMREFIQQISWEMYSTSRDTLDYSEGLPLLKSIYKDASESELAELADVAIVNQPELTKGEERGFEFVHKSFSEYFVAEKVARTLENVSFKARDYDDRVTWRMSIKDALSDLSSILSIRILTAEIQEMLEPMMGDFKEFSRTVRESQPGDLANKLATKKARLEQVIGEYSSGKYQTDVVERVKGSRIVNSERDMHANCTAGLLIIGCALCKRLSVLGRSDAPSEGNELLIKASHLWKLIAVIQAGDVHLDVALSQRCLSPIRISGEGEEIDVLYPPIAINLLRGVKGASFPMVKAAETILRLLVESLIKNALGPMMSRVSNDDEVVTPHRMWEEYFGIERSSMRHRPWYLGFIDSSRVLEQVGMLHGGDWRILMRYIAMLERDVYEAVYRGQSGERNDRVLQVFRRLRYYMGKKAGWNERMWDENERMLHEVEYLLRDRDTGRWGPR